MLPRVCRQHAQQEVDEESPGWRHLLPTDAQLLAESRRAPHGARGGGADGGGGDDASGAPLDSCTTAELCTLDMMAVLSQLRYLAAMLQLLWRLLTAPEPAGAHARAAAAGCRRLLAALCQVAVHRWACLAGCCAGAGLVALQGEGGLGEQAVAS